MGIEPNKLCCLGIAGSALEPDMQTPPPIPSSSLYSPLFPPLPPIPLYLLLLSPNLEKKMQNYLKRVYIKKSPRTKTGDGAP